MLWPSSNGAFSMLNVLPGPLYEFNYRCAVCPILLTLSRLDFLIVPADLQPYGAAGGAILGAVTYLSQHMQDVMLNSNSAWPVGGWVRMGGAWLACINTPYTSWYCDCCCGPHG